MTAGDLTEGYATFNPHAAFQFCGLICEATQPDWSKRNPSDPICCVPEKGWRADHEPSVIHQM